jgi:hypothetical protein
VPQSSQRGTRLSKNLRQSPSACANVSLVREDHVNPTDSRYAQQLVLPSPVLIPRHGIDHLLAQLLEGIELEICFGLLVVLVVLDVEVLVDEMHVLLDVLEHRMEARALGEVEHIVLVAPSILMVVEVDL